MFFNKEINNLQKEVNNLKEETQSIKESLKDISNKLNSITILDKKKEGKSIQDYIKISWLFWLQVIILISFIVLVVINKRFDIVAIGPWPLIISIGIALISVYLIILSGSKEGENIDNDINYLLKDKDTSDKLANLPSYFKDLIIYQIRNIFIRYQAFSNITFIFLVITIIVIYIRLKQIPFNIEYILRLLILISILSIFLLSDNYSNKSFKFIKFTIASLSIPTILAIIYTLGYLYLNNKNTNYNEYYFKGNKILNYIYGNKIGNIEYNISCHNLTGENKKQCYQLKNKINYNLTGHIYLKKWDKNSNILLSSKFLSGQLYGIKLDNITGNIQDLEKIYSDTLNSKYISIHENGRLLFNSLLTLFLFSLTILFWKAYKKEYNNYKKLLNKLIKIGTLLSKEIIIDENFTQNLKTKLRENPEELLPLLLTDDEENIDSKLLDKIKNTIEEILKNKTKNPTT